MPRHGDIMGCKGSAPARNSTDEKLSRTYDILAMAYIVGGSNLRMSIWAALPHDLRMDYNYSRWTYVEPTAVTHG